MNKSLGFGLFLCLINFCPRKSIALFGVPKFCGQYLLQGQSTERKGEYYLFINSGEPDEMEIKLILKGDQKIKIQSDLRISGQFKSAPTFEKALLYNVQVLKPVKPGGPSWVIINKTKCQN